MREPKVRPQRSGKKSIVLSEKAARLKKEASQAAKRAQRKTSGYDLASDVWSAGMIFAQLIFEVPEATVSDDDSKDVASAEAFTRFAKECLADSSDSAKKRGKSKKVDKKKKTPGKNSPHLPSGFLPCLPLIMRMLHSDPRQRPTASACLAEAVFHSRPALC
jgi:serine/threonine protein kinase